MGKRYIALLAVALFAASLLTPALALAECHECPPGQICNPLRYCTIPALIDAILKFLQNIALAITALVIVIAGYMFVTSMGDPQKVSNARMMVIYALVGLAIILIARGIVALIEKVIGVK